MQLLPVLLLFTTIKPDASALPIAITTSTMIAVLIVLIVNDQSLLSCFDPALFCIVAVKQKLEDLFQSSFTSFAQSLPKSRWLGLYPKKS